MNLQGGTQANINGRVFEKHIITQLEDKGLVTISSRLMDQLSTSMLIERFPNGVIAKGRNHYTSIYGNPRCFSEYRVYKNENLHFRLECKWQQGSGSVHEKIPYFYMNFIEDKFPEPMTIFVYGGNAIISSAEWLKKAWEDRLYVKKDFNKELKVFNLDQFMEWSNREF
tara:strand:- start:176 stop:682 length:507 start_codon:yes stop_codon:yes gene_type:complete